MSSFNDNHAIQQEIERIRSRDPKSTIYGVWNSILNLHFPVTEGYITRPQDEHAIQGGEKGYSDLHTFHYSGNAAKADKFLIVQCKRSAYEGWGTVWAEGVDQLHRYLGATHRTRRPADRSPVYGIVAVGRLMRAYRYNDVTRRAEDWAPHGMKSGVPYSIRKEGKKVQRILEFMYANH